MIVSMIPSVSNIFVNKSIVDMRFLSPYNPLINYDWSTTTTSGLRYLKDIGSTPTYNAAMYFGRGAYLNGVDQTITVPINTTIQTTLKRVNGVVTINEASQTLTNYMINGLGVHKDYYLFTRLLTTAEKDSYTNTPELFYAMAQSDSTCVLNMPMCETDSYVRNMKNYNEIYRSNFSENIDGWLTARDNSTLISQNNVLSATSNASSTYGISKELNNLIVGKAYSISYYVKQGIGSNNFYTRVSSTKALSDIVVSYQSGVFYDIKETVTFVATAATMFFGALSNTPSSSFTLEYCVVIDKGIYPITNYTSSVRDNAKNLQYGLQTCKFVRDSLGVIQSASDYLVCDGVGYGDTGWKPSVDESFYLHLNLDFVHKGTASVIGIRDTSTTSTSFGFYCSGTTYIQLIFGGISFLYIVDTTKLKNYDFRFEFNKDDYTYRIFDGATLLSNGTITLANFKYSFILGARNFNGAVNTPSSYKINNFEVHNKLLTNKEIQAL